MIIQQFYYYNNFKKLPKDKYIYKMNNIDIPFNGNKFPLRDNEKVLIYFDSSFYPNLGIMKIDKNWNKSNLNNNFLLNINNNIFFYHYILIKNLLYLDVMALI